MRPVSVVLLVAAVAAVPGPALRGQSPARFDSWNLGYAIPAGWQLAQQIGRVHGLMSGSGAVIYVAPGMYGSFTDVATDVAKGFQALGLTGVPMGQPTSSTIKGLQAMTVTYAGQNQMGTPLQSRITAVLTPHGTGLVVTGIAAMQLMDQVGAAVDQIAQSIDVRGAPQPNPQAVAALRGRWMLYSGRASGTTSAMGGSSRSYEETVEFDGAGRFAWQSSASVMVTTPGYTGSAGGANASSDQGTYTVIGTTLVARGQQGQASFEIQILADRIIADGKTYLRTN
jgi:hypothetical protein